MSPELNHFYILKNYKDKFDMFKSDVYSLGFYIYYFYYYLLLNSKIFFIKKIPVIYLMFYIINFILRNDSIGNDGCENLRENNNKIR